MSYHNITVRLPRRYAPRNDNELSTPSALLSRAPPQGSLAQPTCTKPSSPFLCLQAEKTPNARRLKMRLPRRCAPRNDNELSTRQTHLAVHPHRGTYHGKLLLSPFSCLQTEKTPDARKLKMRLPRRCAPRNDREAEHPLALLNRAPPQGSLITTTVMPPVPSFPVLPCRQAQAVEKAPAARQGAKRRVKTVHWGTASSTLCPQQRRWCLIGGRLSKCGIRRLFLHIHTKNHTSIPLPLLHPAPDQLLQ